VLTTNSTVRSAAKTTNVIASVRMTAFVRVHLRAGCVADIILNSLPCRLDTADDSGVIL
jgi:hypothetical protein